MGDLTALWSSAHVAARTTRTALLPLAVGYRMATGLRAAVARARWGRGVRLPVPAVAVGNLVVGGTGKTPLAAWIAEWYRRQGLRPGIVLRGYGGDEADIHRRTVPDAVVVEHPRRLLAARLAVDRGADILVFDDAMQRLELRPDLSIALVGTGWSGSSPWLLPAGPWREPVRALRRADLIVVTTRPPEAPWRLQRALAQARQGACPVAVAELRIAGFERLCSGEAVPARNVHGRRVLAVAGIAHPRAFASQLTALGTTVRLRALRDHARFSPRIVARLARAVPAEVDYVVVTAKDAAKLRSMWPCGIPEPLVATLALRWRRGKMVVEEALRRTVEGRS